MEYKRKLSTQQEGVSGNDPAFGNLKMVAKSKRMMPIIFAVVMLVFTIAICISGVEIPGNIIVTVLLIIFLFLGIMQLATTLDKIEFYEYGLIDYTCLNIRKKRLAYDDIDAIVEVKKRFLMKESNRKIVALWKIHPKTKKSAIVIDASAFIGISNMMVSLRHDTKIKNIAD